MPIPGILEQGPSSGGQEIRFTDEPLEPVTQDNIDITCEIGGRQYQVVDIEVQLTDGSASNWASGVIVPDGHSILPTANALDTDVQPETIKIDVDNELMEVRDDADEEITRIFTGVISNSSRIKDGAFEFTAFWPGYNEIQNGDIIVSAPPPIPITQGGDQLPGVDYSTRRQYIDEIAEQIADYVTEGTEFDSLVNIREDGWDVGGVTYGDNSRVIVSGESVPLVADGNDEGVLERIVKASNSVWEVDRYGNFHIGPPTPAGPTPGESLPTSVTSHKLRYITETSAGIKSPAWGSIVVIGDGVVSKDGWSSSAQVAENPQKFSSPITETDVTEGVKEDLAEPVFEYVNLEISTASEAKHVLEKLREEIKKQRASGEISIVGHPEIWPGDGIELPDSERQPFGLERFAVSKVTHRLNNSDGFLTKIEVMGATNAAESTFSTQVSPDDFGGGRYDTDYTDEELDRIKSGQQGL